jgi:hypothetical protein
LLLRESRANSAFRTNVAAKHLGRKTREKQNHATGLLDIIADLPLSLQEKMLGKPRVSFLLCNDLQVAYSGDVIRIDCDQIAHTPTSAETAFFR